MEYRIMENKKYITQELDKFLKADLVAMIREMQAKGVEVLGAFQERHEEVLGDMCEDGKNLLAEAYDAFKLPVPMEQFELAVTITLPKGTTEDNIEDVRVTLNSGEEFEYDYLISIYE